jgi:hypothetical protein
LEVSIIIVSYNTKQYILNSLKTIYKYTADIDIEIIIVDNLSSDNSEEIITNTFKDIIWINNNLNNGFGTACNIGARVANGKYLFFLNPDTLLVNNAIKILYDFLEAHTNIAACGGNLLYNDLSHHISYGNFPSIKQVFFEQFLKHFFKSYYESIALTGIVKEKNPFEVDYISGANIMITKKIFDSIEGFDEDFFLFYEETEMCFRLKQQNYINIVVPEAKIIHLHKKTDKNLLLDRLKMYKTSEKLFFIKTQGINSWKIVYIVYYISYSFKYILSRNKKFKNFLEALRSVGFNK